MSINFLFSIKIHKYMAYLFIVYGFQIYGVNGHTNLGIWRLRFLRDLDIIQIWYFSVLLGIKL